MFSISGNTTNLVFHIKHEHKELIPQADEPVRDKHNMLQPKIQIAVTRQYLPHERQSCLNDLLLKLIVIKSMPLSLISNDAFKKFVSVLEPRYLFLFSVCYLLLTMLQCAFIRNSLRKNCLSAISGQVI
jgi:hypothetical protein